MTAASAAWDVWVCEQLARVMPRCFDSRYQWEAWVAQAADVSLQSRPPAPTGFCADCLPEYKERMLECGRCERPEIKFQQVGPDAWVGVRDRHGPA